MRLFALAGLLGLAGSSVGARPSFHRAANGFVSSVVDAPVAVDSAGAISLSGVTVETVEISRGERLAPPAGRARQGAGGKVVTPRGLATEEVEALAEGVEQRWVFSRRPGGSGDLQIRVRVSGGRGEPAGGGALRFRTPTAPVAVRYGRASFVDASGRRTHVSSRLEGSEVVFSVPSAAVDRARFPAVLDPTLSAEVAVDTPVLGPTAGGQYYPSIAFDGTNYLAVWADSRVGGAIWGARVSPIGKLLDPIGFRIAATPGGGPTARPRVAFGGTTYLVVWQQSSSTVSDIVGARVSPQGTVLDSPPLAIAALADVQETPSVGSDGTGFLVTWQDHRSGTGYDWYAGRVTSAGAVLDPSGIALTATNSGFEGSHPSAVGYTGANYLVVWES